MSHTYLEEVQEAELFSAEANRDYFITSLLPYGDHPPRGPVGGIPEEAPLYDRWPVSDDGSNSWYQQVFNSFEFPFVRLLEGKPRGRTSRCLLSTKLQLGIRHADGRFVCHTQEGGTPSFRKNHEDLFCALDANVSAQCGWVMGKATVRGAWAMSEYLVHAAWPDDYEHVLVPDRETLVFAGAWDKYAAKDAWTIAETKLGVDVIYYEATDFPVSVRADEAAGKIEILREDQVIAWITKTAKTTNRGGARENVVCDEPLL